MVFKKILVPIDGSENSYRALRVAAVMAQKFESKITIFHVIPLNTTAMGISSASGITVMDSLISELTMEGERFIDKAKAILEPYKIAFETEIVSGAASQAIHEKATDDYDLVVIGSRGLGGVKGILLGSVSDRVSHTAGQPVLIVH